MALLDTLVVKLIGDISNFESSMDKASSKWSSVGAKMTQTGAMMTAAVTAPLIAIGLGAIDAASNLNESMNKVDVVFGENADVVKKWAEGAAQALGQSEQGALDAAGTFGNLFDSMGIGVGTSTQMSQGIVELASDLASFNNIDPTVALEKLRAGLLGEAEPLRTLGVNLSAAAIEAKALEMGLVGADGELTAAAKAQAAYALILEQTKNAQGDFANTSDGLANSTRIMKAQFADVAANLGQQLLPIALKVVTVLSDWIDRFSNLSPETQKWILIVAGVAAAIGPVLVVVGTLISSIGAIIGVFAAAGPVIAGIGPVLAILTGPIGLIVAAIAGLAYAWSQNWFGIRDFTDSIFGEIDFSFTGLKDSIGKTWTAAWDGITAISQLGWDDYKGMASASLSAVENALGLSQGTIAETFTKTWTAIKDAVLSVDWLGLGTGIIQAIVNGLSMGASTLFDAVQNTAQGALDIAKNLLGISTSSASGNQGISALGSALGFSSGSSSSSIIDYLNSLADDMRKQVLTSLSAADIQAIGRDYFVTEDSGITDRSDDTNGVSSAFWDVFNDMIGAISQNSGQTNNSNSISMTLNFNGATDATAVRDGARGGVLEALRQVGLA